MTSEKFQLLIFQYLSVFIGNAGKSVVPPSGGYCEIR